MNNEYYTAHGKQFKKYILKSEIDSKVQEIAEKINKDYSGKKVLFIVVLKGSIFFAADLLRKIDLVCEIDTVRASSYGNEMKNSTLRLCVENLEIEGKHVIVIEDIVDTGNTLSKLMDKIKDEKPLSLEAVAFLSKPAQKEVEVDVKYIGIEIPPLFVIGYGLDFAEVGRNLQHIYILDE